MSESVLLIRMPLPCSLPVEAVRCWVIVITLLWMAAKVMVEKRFVLRVKPYPTGRYGVSLAAEQV